MAVKKNCTAPALPVILDRIWAEDLATQERDQSANSDTGMRGRRKPPPRQHAGGNAVNPTIGHGLAFGAPPLGGAAV